GLFWGKLFGWIGKAIKAVAKVFAVILAVAAVLAFSWGFGAIGVAALLGAGIFAAIGWGSGKLAEFAGAFLGTLGSGGNFRTPNTFPQGTGVGGVANFVQQSQRNSMPPYYTEARIAAISILRSINPKSKKEDKEYAGSICRTANGSIYTTTPNP